ncbi:YdcH family protein [Tepidamorphus sp. 3E244]|uniref:YdcH family protein n=1 Tax=Tepidamorphus sp. 3E244 TaxID=3385498 RepID=UPI0038FCF97B
MSLAAHLDELVEKHRVLEQTLETERQRPYADDLQIAALKKRKLHLKDEINRLRGDEAGLSLH